MSEKVPVEEFREREYWTCEEAARVLGRGDSYWRQRFDRGDVEGYRAEGTLRVRYISAASARAYLKGLCDLTAVKLQGEQRALTPEEQWRERGKYWRARSEELNRLEKMAEVGAETG